MRSFEDERGCSARVRGEHLLVVSLILCFSHLGWAELQPGRPAPAFKEKNVEGQVVISSQLRGSAAILDFWTTWAKLCSEAMPHWEKLYQKYSSKGVLVIGIDMDENPKLVKPFLKQKGITYDILLDTEGRVAAAYKVREQPTTYIIDRRGVIRHVYAGYKPGLEKIVEQNLQDLIKER